MRVQSMSETPLPTVCAAIVGKDGGAADSGRGGGVNDVTDQ